MIPTAKRCRRCLILSLLLFSAAAPARVFVAVTQARAVAERIIVVFQAHTLPADASARVEKAGGKVVDGFDSVGILVAEPVSVDAATLIKHLREDASVLDADYDRIFDLPVPDQTSADGEDTSASAEAHRAHPLPFSRLLPPDFFYTSTPQQWSVKRVGAQGGGILGGGGAAAWDTTFGAGVKIAILDTGVNRNHPDLAERVIFSHALTFHDPAAFGELNCEVPDLSNPPFDLPIDQVGHGTGTASLAAASVGGGLLIGVAPEASILAIKVLRGRAATDKELTPFNRCRLRGSRGFFSWVLAGILLANQQGADVISMSLGDLLPRNSPGGAGAAIWSAFNRVTSFATSNGSLIVAGAGNDALDLDNLGSLVRLPADSPNVIAVTATTNPDPALFPPTPPGQHACDPGEDCLAFYSNFGSSLRGLAAPGGELPVGACAFGGSPCNPTRAVRAACSSGLPDTSPPTSMDYPEMGPPPLGTSWGCGRQGEGTQHQWYQQLVGTSASAPLVAGVAALVKAANPSLSTAEIRTILQQTAQDIGKVGYDQFFNHGLVLVDAAAAVAAAVRRPGR